MRFILPILTTVMLSALITLPASASLYGRGTYGSCGYDECSISLTTLGSVSLSVTPVTSDIYAIDKDEALVTTGSSAGYTLQLESDDAGTGLVGSTDTIDATSGSLASPVTLSSDTWGYRIDDVGGFGSGPTSPMVGPSSSLTFAGLSANGAPTTLKTTTEPADADATEVWYGIRISQFFASGSYSRTVLYTATAN